MLHDSESFGLVLRYFFFFFPPSPKQSDSPSYCMLDLEKISAFFFHPLFVYFFKDIPSIMSVGLLANSNKYIGNKLHYYMSQQE